MFSLLSSFLVPSFPFFFNDTAPTEIYPLSLHDALPILLALRRFLALATDKEAARLNSYLKVPLLEPRHLDINGKLRFRLSDIHRTAAQDFRLSAKPVLQLLAVGKSSGLRQLIGTTRDQLFDLLHALEERVTCKKFEDFWRAKKFCWGFHPRFSFQENLSSSQQDFDSFFDFFFSGGPGSRLWELS